ncbi:TetR/AcrR family transcriptional regulator [Amycolatopsis alkalitolerans]|uniref:TetR/AcrR family transcriptional regulator n=1 Tax=Amycolatopsis alkalitolerans TaxID=2547244 RepID=A0A5C4M5U3_9PSEU|nr:TetR/AcrR family transcriptional regulator [Amycolatopsis alkalitolerans]TNC28635.1 TetR/AcrR family transcriptional regulator [Amycolatopsis alkalitolerans]
MTNARPLRADAQRNRARVLAAAEWVFAERGTATSTEEVARAAGVGVGTVFRHFPSKEALLQALVVQRLARVAADAREHATSPNAGAAFFDFFAATVRGSATKLELVDALAELGIHPDDAVAPIAEEVTEALAALLQQAQRAGSVRRDVDVRDVIALLAGASQARRYAPDDRPLDVILDGLRAPSAH